MNGVIYARYSSDNQREESIEGQIRECMEYAEQQGITVFGTYIDRALSAKTDNRPEFQRMIKDSGKRLFDVILVWKLDRFARNRYDSAYYKNMLKKNGVRVISAKESISEGPEGIILEAMLEGFAEYYSAELAVKVLRGMKENALKCRHNGGTITFGYMVDEEQRYQIDPVAAPYVAEAFQQYADGKTIKEVMDYLNERGIPSGRNGRTTFNTVSHMLKNRRYIGEYRYRDIVIPGGIPAIISPELFDRVQERMEKNRRAPSHHKAVEEYILTTKLHCGKCGAFMVGESGTSQTARRTYHYYKCANAKKGKKCKKRAVKKQWIEDYVVNETMDMLRDDKLLHELADRLVAYQSQESALLPILQKQLVETERGIQNILNAIQQGVLTESTKQRLEELEEAKRSLQTKILEEELQNPVPSKEHILYWLYKFRNTDTGDPEQRKRLIDSFVNAMYVYDDGMLLTFNYKDGARKISFKDLKSSDLGGFGRPKQDPMGPVFILPGPIHEYLQERGGIN